MKKIKVRVLKGLVAGGRPRAEGDVIALDENMDTTELLARGVVERLDDAPEKPEPAADPTATEDREADQAKKTTKRKKAATKKKK